MRREGCKRTLHAGGIPREVKRGTGRGMGDYVLESNPALERLIERLGAQGKRPGPEESSRFHGARRFQRRGRSKTPTRTVEDPTTVGARKRAEIAGFVEPTSIVEELVVEDHVLVIHEDRQAAAEIVLVDFDEAPAVFAEERGDGETLLEGDEADEVLDVYGRADRDERAESGCEDAEASDRMGMLLEEDDEDDEDGGASGRTIGAVEDAAGDWIFNAFKAWMLEVDEAIA
jgi:hypothetical protein